MALGEGNGAHPTLLGGSLTTQLLPGGKVRGRVRVCGWEERGEGGRVSGEVFCGREFGQPLSFEKMAAFCVWGGGSGVWGAMEGEKKA